MQQEYLTGKAILTFAPKALGAVIGAILSLVLAGDIDRQGRLQLGKTVLVKFVVSAVMGAYIGDAIIIYYKWQDQPLMFHGFVWMTCATLGLLIVGILYQSIAMYQGKSLTEIITDVKQAFKAIFK